MFMPQFVELPPAPTPPLKCQVLFEWSLTTECQDVVSSESWPVFGQIACLAWRNWWWRWDNWRIWNGTTCFGTLGSIAEIANAALVVAAKDLDVAGCSPSCAPGVLDKPIVFAWCSISSISYHNDGMIDGLAGTPVKDTWSVVAKSRVTGIDVRDSRAIGGHEGHELGFSASIVRQSRGNVSSTVINGLSCWAGQLRIGVEVRIVDLVHTLTLQSCCKESSISSWISPVASVHITGLNRKLFQYFSF